MAKLGILAVYGTVLQAFFRPLALVTYARYDPAVKDKHLLHDLMRMFVLYGGGVPCVCDQREWSEKGLQDSPVLPECPTSPLISGLT